MSGKEITIRLSTVNAVIKQIEGSRVRRNRWGCPACGVRVGEPCYSSCPTCEDKKLLRELRAAKKASVSPKARTHVRDSTPYAHVDESRLTLQARLARALGVDFDASTEDSLIGRVKRLTNRRVKRVTT